MFNASSVVELESCSAYGVPFPELLVVPSDGDNELPHFSPQIALTWSLQQGQALQRLQK